MYQATQTFKIEEVDEFYGGVPFEENRKPYTGIFEGCRGGDFTFDYNNFKAVTPLIIQQMLIEEYAYRECSFDTFQEFKHHIMTTWNRNIYQLLDSLKEIPTLNYNEESEVTAENLDNTITGEVNNTGENKYTNTPNQYQDYGSEGLNGLTEYSQGTGKVNNTSTGKSKRDLTITKSRNQFEKWLSLSSKNYNVIYHFIDKFEGLFTQTSRIMYCD